MGKISGYTAIGSVQTDDLLVVVDVHDTTMAPTGTTKSMTIAQLPFLRKVADAGTAGVALANGTPTICSYTTPNDGVLHPVVVFLDLVVATLEVGGATGVTFTDASNTLRSGFQILSGGQAAGLHAWGFNNFLAYPNTSFAVVQTSALTGGAATAYAQVFAA